MYEKNWVSTGSGGYVAKIFIKKDVQIQIMPIGRIKLNSTSHL